MIEARTLELLDFPAISRQLADRAVSAIAKEWALHLRLAGTFERMGRRLKETEAAQRLLRHYPDWSIGALGDLRPLLRRAARGGVLTAAELLHVAELLRQTRSVRDFLQDKGVEEPLQLLARQLFPRPQLEEQLREALLPPDDLKPGASPLLSQLRRRRQEVEKAIKSLLEGYLRSPQWQRYLQEPLVTVREGRYVLPVKVEHQDRIRGLVHDQSASGATLFIEPWEVVEKGNELRRLELQEREEKERLLGQLSSLVRQEVRALYRSLISLARIDLALARGRLAQEWDAVVPRIEDRPRLRLRGVRHPLLGRRSVPLDLELGYAFDVLVITGPNTGGKTVALKTVGLSVLMARAGLALPAREAEIGWFERILADIGDEQSVAENLSTFSAHLRNLARFLAQASDTSLVLLDELGAGTDPREGGVLGCAILEELLRRGAKVVATTHLSEIKNFVLGHSRAENAAVDFDPETYAPTYRLVLGRPGQSLAFEMAERLGLPPPLVARAKELLRPEEREERELTAQLVQKLAEVERELEEARRQRREAEELARRYRQAEARLRERREQLMAQAREQAAALVRQARREADALLRELREQIREEVGQKREQALHDWRRRMRTLGERYQTPPLFPAPAPSANADQHLTVGSAVLVPSLGREGTVMALEGDKVTVQVGAFKLELPRVAVQPAVVRERYQERTPLPASSVSPVLDLRGQRAEEALEYLSRQLDAALLAGLTQVTVIHGHGTGKLRQAVRSFLTDHPQVKAFRSGTPEEGGAGVTVVELV
ncbi:endonuclease MutS2 [Desulfothermobacter acidiphilus]|uniref:endonuclease MutS2 n=1 Tax=Desulfothermobacter acidiphilus TaxID=1938353 RepID=UPI003F8AFF87